MKLRKVMLAAGAAALLGAAPAPAALLFSSPQAQDPPKQEAKPRPKPKKKVWTNEDVKDLRKPWDEHQARKAAEQAAASAPAPAAEPAEAAAPAEGSEEFPLPATVEETEKLLAQYVESIRVQTERIRTGRMQYYDEADTEKRDTLRRQLDEWAAELEGFEKQEKRLTEHLARLKAQAPQPPAAAPPAEQPAPPPEL